MSKCNATFRIAIYLCIAIAGYGCAPERGAKLTNLTVVPVTNTAFRSFLEKHRNIARYYEADYIRQGKYDDLRDLGCPQALEDPETASLVFFGSYRSPDVKWYSTEITIKTKHCLVKYGEALSPEEYDFFIGSNIFVLSGKRAFKDISVWSISGQKMAHP